ncbi:hypothetical protein ACGFZR_07960 [Streptomyces sp. NPDC048241]|uniref:hypothetical protein n=1 Tax=Streptomyces sp. NPDC048241 TaxID=3365521 RepID=UPI003715EBFE
MTTTASSACRMPYTLHRRLLQGDQTAGRHPWKRTALTQRGSTVASRSGRRGKRPRLRRRPDTVLADRSYDHDKYRHVVWDLVWKPAIARRGTAHSSGLGTQLWVVERAFAHLCWFRRPRIRGEIRDDIT